MTSADSSEKKPITDSGVSAARGEKAFAAFDYAIKVVKVTVVVLGIMILIIALSGVDMALLDEHKIFRYRMYAGPVAIVGYLLIDYWIGVRRSLRAPEAAATPSNAVHAGDEFVLSIDPQADRRAADIAAANKAGDDRPKRGYAAEFMALTFVAAGAVAFWHDHMSQEIPNPVAVVGKFVSATCVDRSRKGAGVGVVVEPHMSIGYEFPSQSTSVRVSQTQCLLANCEPEKAPPPYMDTEYKRVFYASPAECKAALPAMLALKAPTTVWTGDKDPNASVRARFTPEREKPPYFLLWIPSVVAAVVLLTSGFVRLRRTRLD